MTIRGGLGNQSENAVRLRNCLQSRAFELAEERGKRFTLRQAAVELRLSESTIQRLLCAAFGMGFQGVLDAIRVERALTLLADEPDFNIESLALTVGWRGRANLYAAIRRTTGAPLVAFRSDSTLLQTVLGELQGALGTSGTQAFAAYADCRLATSMDESRPQLALPFPESEFHAVRRLDVLDRREAASRGASSSPTAQTTTRG